jgi:hypothetical protein
MHRVAALAATAFLLSYLLLARAAAFADAWRRAASQLEADAWMRGQCANATFFAQMGLHTDVCVAVARRAEAGTHVAALREALAAPPWPLPGWRAAAALLLLPAAAHAAAALLAPLWRRRRARRVYKGTGLFP